MSNVPPSPALSTGPQPKQWSNRLAIFAALAMVLGPVSFMAIPREIASWHAAAAQEADWSDNDTEAFAQLDKALAWDPQNGQWWLQRAKQHQARQRYEEALADCDQALVVEPDHPLAAEQRNEVLVLLKRYDEVIADWRKRLQVYETEGIGDPRQIYNGLAYFLAVANREPEEALQLVQKVLEKEPRDPGVLDTRGFIYYRLGKLGEARSDLDQAIHLMEIQMPYVERQLKERAADPRQLAHETATVNRVLAVLLYHRSLVLDKLGEKAAADKDRERIQKLGCTPDESLF